jgi:hypothetical protein
MFDPHLLKHSMTGMPPERPSFTYCVDQPAVYLSPSDPQWSRPIPLARRPDVSFVDTADQGSQVTFGEYFLAAEDFLSQHFETLVADLQRSSCTAAKLDTIKRITIHLVKHGAFYHPARITLSDGNSRAHLVLNVAVSKAGRALLNIEAANLKRLGREATHRRTPEVYAVGEGAVAGKSPLPMFAAQWFDGFSEFHSGPDPDHPGGCIWRVWDETGDWKMSRDELRQVMEQAACILTTHYHPVSFEAILDWHLAAGDFIIRRQTNGMDVRLITVRRYAPLLEADDNNPPGLDRILDGLMLFFMDISLHLRMDRLDGVGEVVWADDSTPTAIWEGFVLGLDQMAHMRGLPREFVDGVLDYAKAHNEENLLEIGRQVHKRMRKLPEESALIGHHLHSHVATLAALVQSHHEAAH